MSMAQWALKVEARSTPPSTMLSGAASGPCARRRVESVCEFRFCVDASLVWLHASTWASNSNDAAGYNRPRRVCYHHCSANHRLWTNKRDRSSGECTHDFLSERQGSARCDQGEGLALTHQVGQAADRRPAQLPLPQASPQDGLLG